MFAMPIGHCLRLFFTNTNSKKEFRGNARMVFYMRGKHFK